MTETVTNEAADVQQPEQTPQDAPNLTLQDLVLVAQVIQVSSQRGAIRAEEMTTVGALYTKLIAFLQASGALAKQEEQPAAEEPAAE